jgi:hypothetical protein
MSRMSPVRAKLSNIERGHWKLHHEDIPPNSANCNSGEGVDGLWTRTQGVLCNRDDPLRRKLNRLAVI